MEEFKDKVAVVTGAASGIGRGLAERFAAEGMRVVLADVEEEPLAAVERGLTAGGATALSVRTDVSKPDEVEALAQRAFDEFGGAHVVCNNAGVGGGGLTWQTALEDWQWVLGVNLWGVINGIRSFVPRMLEAGDEGHIVNTASLAGLVAGGGNSAYTASKFGVVGLSEVLYHELLYLAGGKIGISVLCPGPVDTNIVDSDRNRPGGPAWRPEAGTMEAAILEGLRKTLKEGLSPADVAEMVVDAIRTKRFYVLTHDDYNDVITKRTEGILSGGPPAAIQPS